MAECSLAREGIWLAGWSSGQEQGVFRCGGQWAACCVFCLRLCVNQPQNIEPLTRLKLEAAGLGG